MTSAGMPTVRRVVYRTPQAEMGCRAASPLRNERREAVLRGSSPASFGAFAARLKSCPDTNLIVAIPGPSFARAGAVFKAAVRREKRALRAIPGLRIETRMPGCGGPLFAPACTVFTAVVARSGGKAGASRNPGSQNRDPGQPGFGGPLFAPACTVSRRRARRQKRRCAESRVSESRAIRPFDSVAPPPRSG